MKMQRSILKWGIVLLICVGVLSTYNLINPSLKNMSYVEGNNVGSYLSPNKEMRLTVYFRGGLILHFTDMTYVGVMENLETGEKKNLFIVSPNVGDIRWLDDNTITFNGIRLSIDETYDFRDE